MDGDDRLYISTCGFFNYLDGRNGEWEGGKLCISVCGYFNYLDGRGGQWQSDGGSNWDGEGR